MKFFERFGSIENVGRIDYDGGANLELIWIILPDNFHQFFHKMFWKSYREL